MTTPGIPTRNSIFRGTSMVASSVIFGENCTVWHGATICEETVLGEGVVVGSNVWIGRGCQIGAFTRIQHGAFIPNHTVIGRSVFIGPNATLTDDRYPQAGNHDYLADPPILEDDCSLGASCVILSGVRVGRCAMVGAGAVVTKDVNAMTTVVGCPAQLLNQED